MRNRFAKKRHGIRAVQLGAKEARLKLRRTSFVRVCFQQTRVIRAEGLIPRRSAS